MAAVEVVLDGLPLRLEAEPEAPCRWVETRR